MKVLFTSLREKSHFLPLVPYIEALKQRGHTVGVAAPSDFADRVRALGVEFLPFGHPGEAGLRPVWMRMREAKGDELMRLALSDLFAGACAGAAVPGLIETLDRWKPSIVVRETCEFAALVAAQKVGVRHARVAIFGQQWEANIRTLTAATVDGHRAGVGLPPDPAGDRLRDEPALTSFPRSFEAVEPMGPLFRCRLRRDHAPPPLPNWWGGLDGPFVYVTLGMVTGGFEDLRAMYRTALDALSVLPVRVLMTIGMDLALDVLGELPANVHVERFVPQDDVLPHAAAVLSHGGSGTVLGTLAAGKPMVVVPLFADQPYNAARVEAIGAGIAMPAGLQAAHALRDALSRVLREESFRAAAGRIAEDMAALPTIDDAARELERLASA